MCAARDEIELITTETGVELTVKVVPKASRSAIVGTWQKALKVAVAVPPEGGKANAAVLRLLAESLSVPGNRLVLVSGQTRPLKRIRVLDLTASEIRQRLNATF